MRLLHTSICEKQEEIGRRGRKEAVEQIFEEIITKNISNLMGKIDTVKKFN